MIMETLLIAKEVILRILLAMLIGGCIGWERESTHRPAGIRTHMLVTVGAAVVMMLGAQTVNGFAGIANSDPARLGAQVISGIGFLGAGTILKEGHTVKGLTTAASLWVVACLGLATGAGKYIISIVGLIASMIILRLFNSAGRRVTNGKLTRFDIAFCCTELDPILEGLTQLSINYQADVNSFCTSDQGAGHILIKFQLYLEKPRASVNSAALIEDLSKLGTVYDLQVESY